MLLNPITRKLYTDSGEFIKEIKCPLNMQWDQMGSSSISNSRLCKQCNHEVIDSLNLNETELLEMVKQNEKTCLKVDLNQENIRVAYV